ncbi:hypothetical protein B0T26DRAFT_755112 [Lasiosphaeria miniovina]|uniref:DUF7580 domain-containing protein n=1 Tax=Lasiosphaeria miniovina TaxID=1954250 RepID=A0AA40A639_9PEZI|nr:uncharacterized protein B0T26DRAFT_755112 [Lasiosphaeria miniovina]KAK0709991.1 hypothetical protein B0T26DRAFT_755112 [Lasiosphaeria miniovina]
MSGFEVAGLVLGAFPIAITALDKYREIATRLGVFFKIQLEYKRWRDDLEFHQLVFTRHLRQLLLPLVADDDKIAELLSAPGGDSWRDDAIAKLLQKRLRDSYELYFEYIKGIKRVMADINQELAVDSAAIQDGIKTSKSAAGASRPKTIMSREKLVFQLYRLKFSNNEAVRRRLFGELQEYNNKLEKLLDSSDEDTRLTQQRTAVGQLTAIDTAICNFWIQARTLFRALALAWVCSCQHHGARLLLQHRTTKQHEFQVIFTATRLSSPSRLELYQTRISQDSGTAEASERENVTMLEHQNMNLTVSKPDHRRSRPTKSAFRAKLNTTTSATCVELLRPPPSVTLTRAQTSPSLRMAPPISSLCTSLDRIEGSYCGYVVSDDCRYYVHTISRRSASEVRSLSLDQILRGEVDPVPSRSQRYGLSLTMASSFLQLLDSPWLPATSFHTTDVHFLGDARKPNLFLLDQPHISREFQRSHSLTEGQAAAIDLGGGAATSFTDALDHLGIMLLELCFGQILAEQPCRKRWPAGSNDKERAVFDIMAARDWQRLVNEEAGPDYADAVAWCLGGNRSTLPERWRHEMLRKVIEPLQRCRDYLTGGAFVRA